MKQICLESDFMSCVVFEWLFGRFGSSRALPCTKRMIGRWHWALVSERGKSKLACVPKLVSPPRGWSGAGVEVGILRWIPKYYFSNVYHNITRSQRFGAIFPDAQGFQKYDLPNCPKMQQIIKNITRCPIFFKNMLKLFGII